MDIRHINTALEKQESQKAFKMFYLQLTKKEAGLLFLSITLAVIALFGPHITQFEGYHNFADQSHVFGIPHAWDVLSNLPFLIMGVWGIWATRQTTLLINPSTARDMSLLFYCGLIATFVCSSFYHLNPSNSTLWLDRLGMTVAFAGILGLGISNRISDRAGQVAAYTVLVAGPITLWMWQTTDSLLAWSVLQGGGMLIILVLAVLEPIQKHIRIPLVSVILWYGLSKAFELGDQEIFDLTNGLVSGHSLKHVWAAFAGLPLIFYLRKNQA